MDFNKMDGLMTEECYYFGRNDLELSSASFILR